MLESLLIYLPIGMIAGLMAGLLGLGGGLIVVPILTITLKIAGVPSDMIMKMAVATSFATICFTSMSSVYAHHKRGSVLWSLLIKLLPGLLIGVFVAGLFAKYFSNLFLSYFFAAFVLFSIINLLLSKKGNKSDEVAQKPEDSAVKLSGWGLGIGGISALVGVGGGAMMVPLLNHLGYEMKKAVGTSSAAGFPIALAGTINGIWHGLGHSSLPEYSFGFIYLPALAGIAVTSMLFAPIGAKIAHKLPQPLLKRVFAFYLMIIFVQMVFQAH